MQIDIKDIKKISLKDDELLVFTIPDDMFKDARTSLITNLLPDNWQKRVFYMTKDIDITKVSKEDV